MSKIEKIIFVFLFIISCIYSNVEPHEKIDSIETKPHITIYIEGKVERTLTYDHHPQIKEIFSDLKLENIYGFAEDECLTSKTRFYIPQSHDLISLNHANQEQLMTIHGIGEKTALKIIEQRNIENFHTIEDVMKVKGIGEKTYLRIREYLCL